MADISIPSLSVLTITVVTPSLQTGVPATYIASINHNNLHTLLLLVGRLGQPVYRLATGWTVRGSNPGGGEVFRTCPDWPWEPPCLLYNRYRFFPGGKSGRGVTLTPQLLLVPWSWKVRAIPLLPLLAVRPVQSFSACTRVHITFTFTSYSYIIYEYSSTVLSYNMHLSMMNHKNICVESYIENVVLTELQRVGSKTLRLVTESISTPFIIIATPSGVTRNVASPRRKQLVPH